MKSVKDKTIRPLIWLIMLIGFSAAFAAIGSWESYTYSDNSRDIVGGGQYLWCATSGGLIRYDILSGEHRKYYLSDGLADIDLISVEIDSSGAVFIGGSNGTLSKITRTGETRTYDFQYTTGIRYNLFDLYADGDVLWVAAEMGIGKFLIFHNGGEFKDIVPQLGMIPRETPVRAVRVVGDYLWAGTDSGLAFMPKDYDFPQDPMIWHSYTRNQNGLVDSRIFSLAAIGDTVFAGSNNGVYYFGADSLWHNIGPDSRTIYGLKYINGSLMVATNAGAYRRNQGTWEMLPNDSLQSIDARSLAVDSLGNAWVAFANGGFATFNGSYWDVVTIPGPPSNDIYDIAIDSSGTIWTANWGDGVASFDGANWQLYNSHNSGLGGNGAVAVEYDHFHDRLWFGSWGDGLYYYDGENWQNFDENNSLYWGVNDFPYFIAVPDIAVDHRGNIWGLDLDSVDPYVTMVVFDPDDSTWLGYYENPAQIPNNHIFELLAVNDDIYAAGNGIFRLHFGQNSLDTTDDFWYEPLTDMTDINALAMDEAGRLFIGSAYGLAYYDSVRQDTVIVDLPDGYRSSVLSIAIDGLGNKWVGTDSGVVVLASNLSSGRPNWIEDFKPTNSFLLGSAVRHIEVDKNSGFVYIATTNGLSIYQSGFAAPSADLSDMAVYPNPVFAFDKDQVIRFLRVPSEAEISIYTAAGELVRRFLYPNPNYWDLRNDKDEKVAAGIYFFYVRAGDRSGSGKFAIIR